MDIAVAHIELGPLRNIGKYTAVAVVMLLRLDVLQIPIQAGQYGGELCPGKTGVQIHAAILVAHHDSLLRQIGGSSFLFWAVSGEHPGG